MFSTWIIVQGHSFQYNDIVFDIRKLCPKLVLMENFVPNPIFLQNILSQTWDKIDKILRPKLDFPPISVFSRQLCQKSDFKSDIIQNPVLYRKLCPKSGFLVIENFVPEQGFYKKRCPNLGFL